MVPDEADVGRREPIIISSDHAGFALKEELKAFLRERGHPVEDLQQDYREGLDYPVVAEEAARRVAASADTYGIVVCGTGIGASMAANKVPGVRAALLYSEEAARMARRHNDANVLALGGRTMSPEQARRYVEAFFSSRFEGGRHQRRVDYMEQMDGRV
jgi:RpiB/LacA/LacB family sugar-phosphate isomerase